MDKKYDIRKTYLRLCGVILLGFLIFLLAAGYFRRAGREEAENLYRVEISRIERLLPADPDQIDLSGFETIRGVSVYEGDLKDIREDGSKEHSVEDETKGDSRNRSAEELARFFDPDFSYVIREAGGKLYRIDYEVDQKKARYDRDRNMFLVLACAFFLILFLLREIPDRLVPHHLFPNIAVDPNQVASVKASLDCFLKCHCWISFHLSKFTFANLSTCFCASLNRSGNHSLSIHCLYAS